mmetsp:Transcript_145038/g.463410  ORF Transcript_145038/g.463410 Transcript_145038/m.463410 type:complete len:103 (+) Transcript_145038:111-419(+)
MKEAVDINRSLMALKECMCKRSTGAETVPFRQNRLTLLLRDAFEFSDALCVFIACVSPLLRDLDHTLNTLTYAAQMVQREQHQTKASRSSVEGWSKCKQQCW